MSQEKLAEVVKSTAELKEAQKLADTPEQLKTLPKLSLSDLERKEKDGIISINSFKAGSPQLDLHCTNVRKIP